MSTEFMENCTDRNCGNTSIFTRNVTNLNTNVSVVNDSIAKPDSSLGPHVLKLGLEVLIALFGVVGNALVAIVISKRRSKKATDVYVQNLAIADLGILLLIFPLMVIKEQLPFNWPLGELSCFSLYTTPEIFHGSSVWCIAVIAVERYRKMLKPRQLNQNNKNKSLRNAKIVAACVWLTSLLFLCLPLYFVVEYRELRNGDKWCGPVWHSWMIAKVYIILLTIFCYIFPLFVITWTYLAISRIINRTSEFFKAMKQDQYSVQARVRLRQNKRAKRILTPIVLVFAITMLPLNILRLAFAFWPVIIEQEYYNNILYAVSVFIILNSSVNPVIYCIGSRDFRSGVKSLLLDRLWGMKFFDELDFSTFCEALLSITEHIAFLLYFRFILWTNDFTQTMSWIILLNKLKH